MRPLLGAVALIACAAAPVLVGGAACGAVVTPVCTNGSFEELGPDGFPADWEPVGDTVEVSSDAHSGRRGLRLVRTPGTRTLETGLNRAWRAGSGERGCMIDRLKGGIQFWYKAVSATNARLTVYVIPMTADPIERTGSPRATFTVPAGDIGDGRWHRGLLKYDFTAKSGPRRCPRHADNDRVRWVHFSARIVGLPAETAAGELLLDDFAYVERVGPLLAFRAVHLFEDPEQPGRRCTIKAAVRNTGDAAARDVQATLAVPPGLEAAPAIWKVGHLAPDDDAWLVWTLEGERDRAAILTLTATSDEAAARASLPIAPELVIESFGPREPVATVGQEAVLECVLRNTGSASVLRSAAEFRLPAGTVTRTVERLPPGRSVTLKAGFHPTRQTPDLGASVRVRAGNTGGELSGETRLVVAAPAGHLGLTRGPRPEAAVTDEYSFLANEHVCLTFPHNDYGLGPASLSVRTPGGWRRVAWLSRLGRIVYRGPDGRRREDAVFATERPEVGTDERAARLGFTWASKDAGGATWRVAVAFGLSEGEKVVAAGYELTCDEPRALLAFEGPMLHVLERDEAVFPGLEWLVDDEVSSGTLDIAEGHPHRVRYVVHPNTVTVPAVGIHSRLGTVGLLWDVRRKWDGTRDRPSVVFASPDRLENQRAHLVGLFLPSVPEFVRANSREAGKPYPLEPDRPIRLECHIYADADATDALAAIDEWLRIHGLPEPAPLPRGSYEREIEFSMQGYLKSLWEPETKEWWLSKGGHPLMSRLGRPREYIADLLVGAALSPSPEVRRRCRERAEEMIALDALRFGGRADLAMADPSRVAGLLGLVGPDGAWRFDAELKDRGVFEGKDYHELGRDGAVEVGTCAGRASEVLRYARIAGDRDAYDRMRKTLRLMETFRVPRAAQVWEVPVHTPDVLAAADAVDAYVEAYRFSGEGIWLRDAVTWARRGLPFIYLWDDPEKPFLLGASIPVFGATWYQCSWFGCPVQWNGLRYANALLKLAEYDQSHPWRRIAELIIRSAIWQQDPEGENVALWPDTISAIDGGKCPWVFAPRQIIRNILKLTGRDEDPATVILRGRSVSGDEGGVHVTAAGKITAAEWKGGALSFRATFQDGEQGVVLVSNVARPASVTVDGRPIAERADVEKGTEPGWRYDQANAYLTVRIAPSDDRETDGASDSTVGVEGARFRRVTRLPRLARTIDFDFRDSLEGWLPAHHLAGVTARDGALCGRITGGDPYLVRGLLRVRADDCPVILLRMRLTAGGGAQIFWTTQARLGFSEAKSLRFPIRASAEFHEYRIEPGRHHLWRGQIITAIRIDPTSGAELLSTTGAEFAIDYVRGVKD